MPTSSKPKGLKPLHDLPRWLIRHICHAENHKLMQKRPFNWQSGSQQYWHSNSRTIPDSRLPKIYQDIPMRPTDFAKGPSWATAPLAEVAHLGSNDYRLWSETRTSMADGLAKAIQARCRWCEAQYSLREFTTYAREYHKKFCPFTHNLTAVFEILLQRGNCVVCRSYTRQRRWGVPLCGVNCERRWQFAETKTEAFSAAQITASMENRLVSAVIYPKGGRSTCVSTV